MITTDWLEAAAFVCDRGEHDDEADAVREAAATLLALQSIVVRYLRPDGGAVGGDWRPIETAPMASWGSTDVLISGFLESGARYVETSDWRPPYKGEPGYWTHHKTTPPTQWQPLPAPPGEPSRMSGEAFKAEIIATLEAAGYGAFGAGKMGGDT